MLAASAAVSAMAPQAAALSWLSAVDQGQYAQSWSQAADAFRARVTEGGWVAQIGSVRGPLGSVISRRLSGEQMKTSLPGAPDGQYDILQFGTAFAHKPSAIETVVLSREAAGWRATGYFIN